jgi:hypothetical protein
VPAGVLEEDAEFREEKGPGIRYSLRRNPERGKEDTEARQKALAEAEGDLALLRDELSGEKKRKGHKLTQQCADPLVVHATTRNEHRRGRQTPCTT